MARSQSVVVVEHCSLKLKVFLQKRNILDFAFFLNEPGRPWLDSWDIIHIPDVAALCCILIAVDFCLFECPFW